MDKLTETFPRRTEMIAEVMKELHAMHKAGIRSATYTLKMHGKEGIRSIVEDMDDGSMSVSEMTDMLCEMVEAA